MDYERLSEIFKQYGSMTLSWGDLIEEETFKRFFESNAFESTGCTLGGQCADAADEFCL